MTSHTTVSLSWALVCVVIFMLTCEVMTSLITVSLSWALVYVVIFMLTRAKL